MPSRRVSKLVARELIQFVKKIDIKANYWDPTATSAFEFTSQMNSPVLRKLNSKYECTMHVIDEDNKVPASILVEFVNGTKWETNTSSYKADDLRYELFTRAEEVEEQLEAASGGKDDDDKVADKGKKGGGGAKPAAAAPKKK